MHVVEHIGLGRYGDPLDPEGDLKAMAELQRVLAPGGSLYFVVPVGEPRVQFNAHRIYAYRQVIESFPALELRQFALVPDDAETGGLIEGAPPALADQQQYGCGCFWFVKPAPGGAA
jgi:SAM-dependent methyltransferase